VHEVFPDNNNAARERLLARLCLVLQVGLRVFSVHNAELLNRASIIHYMGMLAQLVPNPIHVEWFAVARNEIDTLLHVRAYAAAPAQTSGQLGLRSVRSSRRPQQGPKSWTDSCR